MNKVKLGDVAKERRETYKGNKEGIPNVGLEHLTPGEIKLSNWSNNSENTFSKKFRKGDILFGRRRAYLKKAAVAPFDGVCSGDITVIEAITAKIDPNLLPFIVQNDELFDFAVSQSAGSLSPRVKWQQLKNFEFDLPDLKQQQKISQLLWSMEKVKDSYQEMLSISDEFVKSRFIELFEDKGYPTRKLGDVCLKITDGTHKTPNYEDSGIKFISAKNIKEGTVDLSDTKFISLREYNEIQNRTNLSQGDVLLTKSGSLGSSAVFESDEPVGLFESLAVLKPDNRLIDSKYLSESLKTDNVQRQFKTGTKGVAVKHLHLNVIKNTNLPLPPVEKQKEFSEFAEQVAKSKVEIQKSLDDLNKFKSDLIKKEFSSSTNKTA